MSVHSVWKHIPLCMTFARRVSLPAPHRSCFVGRDFVEPSALTVSEWKEILWTAIDLKQLANERGREALEFLRNKHVTLLSVKPNGRYQVASSLACQMLGARSTQFTDPDFENQPNCADSGRALSRLTDLIVVNGAQQPNVSKIADGANVPVISCSSSAYCIHRTLSDVMTFQEMYGYLKGLTVAWVGPPTSLCNSYICMLPLFGINIRFCCVCSQGSGGMTPIKIQDGFTACRNSASELHQCSSAVEATYRADIIATSMHPDIANKITAKMLEEAAIKWSFIHALPRTDVEVADAVFLHKNNISWLASENLIYVAMALILRALRAYQPRMQMPEFDGAWAR